LLAIDLFVVLVAYYVLKTAREPLILASGGAELRSYAAGMQALVLVPLVPAYGAAVARHRRERFVPFVIAAFIACTLLFALAATLRLPGLGIVFYVWVGVFSLMVVAQFWSVANDVLTEEQGKRIFPVIGLGATLGAAAGAHIASSLFDSGSSVIALFGVAALLLALHFALTTWVMRTHPPRPPRQDHHEETTNGFVLLWRNPYLRAIAVMMLVANLVNTIGEYVLSRTALEDAHLELARRVAMDPTLDPQAFVESRIGAFYGDFFFHVNVLAIALQLGAVSLIVRKLGVRGAVLALPIVALGAYSLIAVGASLMIVRAAKIAENATDYSIMNTGRALLWLPTTPLEKYSAKQAVDSFFVRAGDVFAAGVVLVGTRMLDLGVQSFAIFNVALCVGWIALVVRLGKRHEALPRHARLAAPSVEPASSTDAAATA
jgi:AAA family ATP:ADP antiporter